MNYELVLRGNQTIYLGQNLPLNNLNYFFKLKKDLVFVTSLTVQPYDERIKEYFEEIENLLEKTNHEFIALGRKTSLIKNKIKLINNKRIPAKKSESPCGEDYTTQHAGIPAAKFY